MTEQQVIPLFPLHSVLFPRGKLTLQIFERRYVDLVTSCLRNDTGFGVTLLKDGQEVTTAGRQQAVYDVGTYARIVDWDQLENGLLGITVEGVRKFRIENYWIEDNDLCMGKVSFSNVDAVGGNKIPLEQDLSGLTELLQVLEKHPAVQEMNLQIDYENLWDLGWRLSELIPVADEIKQEMLELDDPWERIKVLEEAIHYLANGD